MRLFFAKMCLSIYPDRLARNARATSLGAAARGAAPPRRFGSERALLRPPAPRQLRTRLAAAGRKRAAATSAGRVPGPEPRAQSPEPKAQPSPAQPSPRQALPAQV